MAEIRPKRQIGVQLGQIARRWRRVVDDRLAAYGLTDATWRPLFHLGRLGDGLRQNELAEALEIQGPSLVRLLDNLEREGLIRRQEDSADRRAKIIVMTEAGREIYRQVIAVTERVSDRLLQGVDDAELAATQRLLDRIGAALVALESGGEA